jgi:hypothetical protein
MLKTTLREKGKRIKKVRTTCPTTGRAPPTVVEAGAPPLDKKGKR